MRRGMSSETQTLVQSRGASLAALPGVPAHKSGSRFVWYTGKQQHRLGRLFSVCTHVSEWTAWGGE